MLTFIEQQEMIAQLMRDIQRLQACANSTGQQLSADEALRIWNRHSQQKGACWLQLPPSDELLARVLEQGRCHP
ncbi:hypothetical protein [Herbaspirillum sp. NPDC087042]|uniref:hypothetical protein n=1 Tax=Herbaspirillum sp. NPDC087042 TaxID=3364004 RepID=UPI0038308583